MEPIDDIRQTFIIIYIKDKTRYIFNRSIPWNSVMNTKNIQPIINVLGKEAINHFIIEMNEQQNEMAKNVSKLTRTFYFDNTLFHVIESHPEWENRHHENQGEINKRKKELCAEWNAVDRIDNITDGNGLDIAIAKMIKEEFKKWLVEIYETIAKYAKLINEEIVKTTLYMTKESIEKDIAKLKKQKQQVIQSIDDLNRKIIENRQQLNKQNFVIDKYAKYIKNLDEGEIEKLKKEILYKEKYYEQTYIL